jgi:hypothetical protein
VTEGVGDNLYGVDRFFNRGQIVTMIGRVAENLLGIEAKGDNPFNDVPHWAAPYVGYAAANGIAEGYGGGEFRPSIRLNNQTTIVFIYRAFTAWM